MGTSWWTPAACFTADRCRVASPSASSACSSSELVLLTRGSTSVAPAKETTSMVMTWTSRRHRRSILFRGAGRNIAADIWPMRCDNLLSHQLSYLRTPCWEPLIRIKVPVWKEKPLFHYIVSAIHRLTRHNAAASVFYCYTRVPLWCGSGLQNEVVHNLVTQNQGFMLGTITQTVRIPVYRSVVKWNTMFVGSHQALRVLNLKELKDLALHVPGTGCSPASDPGLCVIVVEFPESRSASASAISAPTLYTYATEALIRR